MACFRLRLRKRFFIQETSVTSPDCADVPSSLDQIIFSFWYKSSVHASNEAILLLFRLLTTHKRHASFCQISIFAGASETCTYTSLFLVSFRDNSQRFVDCFIDNSEINRSKTFQRHIRCINAKDLVYSKQATTF